MESRDLYGLPLERFTEERNSLARQLRSDGRRDQAAEVSKLRKPSVAAWAVNQLVRTQPRDIKDLFRSGAALQKAQAELLAGRSDPVSLRSAVESERVAVDQLVDRARGLLSSDGHELSPTILEQVSETLHAAALEEEARAAVSDGCLTRELRRAGLGGLAGGAPAPPGPAGPGEKAAPGKKAAPRQKAGPSAAVRRAEADARRRLERAERVLNTAEDRRRRAESELEDAQDALATARENREKAAREHERAQAALKEF